MFEETWFRLMTQPHRAPEEGKQTPCFPKDSEQSMGTVLLMVKASWRLQPSPAECGLGSVNFPLDMDLLWSVEVVPKLGWGRVHAE